MANLPVPTNKSSQSLSEAQIALRQKVVDLLDDGMDFREVVRRLSGGDKAKAKQWRARLRRWARQDPVFQQMVILAVNGQHVLGLAATSAGINRRAARGRVDAAKLVYEITGVYSPRSQVEHTGELKISLSMPRPTPVESDAVEIVDADVVE